MALWPVCVLAQVWIGVLVRCRRGTVEGAISVHPNDRIAERFTCQSLPEKGRHCVMFHVDPIVADVVRMFHQHCTGRLCESDSEFDVHTRFLLATGQLVGVPCYRAPIVQTRASYGKGQFPQTRLRLASSRTRGFNKEGAMPFGGIPRS